MEIGFDYHFGVPPIMGTSAASMSRTIGSFGLNRESPKTPSPPYVPVGQRQGQPVKSLELNAPKRIDDEVMATLTDKVIDWMDRQSADKPFFVYFTPVAVHNPITPSKDTAQSELGGPFCDFIHDLDLSVGQILENSRRRLIRNTLLIFNWDIGGVNKRMARPRRSIRSGKGSEPRRSISWRQA